jgi:hypothetical protein
MISSRLITKLFAIGICSGCLFSHQANAATALSSTRYADFNDWTVACDNAGDCKAIGFDENAVSLAMHIYRAAGPDGKISISIMGGGSQPLNRFTLDGKRLDLSPQVWTSSREDGYKISLNNPDAAVKFIASIRNAQRIGFYNSDTPENSLSLKGLSASLLLIDEIQGRLGSQQAFARKGSRSEASIPAPQPLPKLKAATYRGKTIDNVQAKKIVIATRKQQAAVLTKETCDIFDKADNYDEVSLLSATEVIVLLECSRGAYQSYFLAFRAPLNNLKKTSLLRLPGLPGEAPETSIGNAGYDSKNATLSSYGKGRGIFDCGESISWVFDGKAFQLSQYSMQKRCGGMNAPGEFPALWRSVLQ